MLGKLFKIGKKDKFHLQLDENEVSAVTEKVTEKVEAVATQVKQETKQVAKEAKQIAEESQSAVASTVESVKSEVASVVEEVTPDAVQTAPKAKKTSIKNKKNQQKKSETSVATAPPAIDTSYSEEPFWVKLMYKTSEQQAAEQQAEKTFATDYLISKPKPRRRPGGSIDKFKTMARQTKVRF